ncbi:MAG: hypothetical protein ABEH86_06525 [Haloarcula sp.]
MRYKVAPPVRSLSFLETAREEIPLVPDSESDCCQAIQMSTDVSDRDTAEAYLVFLQALGLVAESDRGYYRTRDDLNRMDLAAAFEEHVFCVDSILEALDGHPQDPESVFEAIRDEIPRWERERHADWEAVWQRRTVNLLEWAVVFDLATESDGAYVRST